MSFLTYLSNPLSKKILFKLASSDFYNMTINIGLNKPGHFIDPQAGEGPIIFVDEYNLPGH